MTVSHKPNMKHGLCLVLYFAHTNINSSHSFADINKMYILFLLAHILHNNLFLMLMSYTFRLYCDYAALILFLLIKASTLCHCFDCCSDKTNSYMSQCRSVNSLKDWLVVLPLSFPPVKAPLKVLAPPASPSGISSRLIRALGRGCLYTWNT